MLKYFKYLPWLGILALMMLIFGTIEGVGQQIQRNAANMPQIQLAEDGAAQLNSTGNILGLVNTPRVDIAKSLAPFVIVYDKSGHPFAGNGFLNGKLAAAPIGILQASTGQDYNSITWQPQPDVRIAAVTTTSNMYYVLSGRNLKEVEANEQETFQISFLGGVLSLFIIGFIWYTRRLSKISKKSRT